MNSAQILLAAVLVSTILLFALGRWRHDIVAMGALLACVLTGLVPADQAFSGFSHPAVITVACVLILSHALIITGAVETITRRLRLKELSPLATIGALAALAAVLSAFMNNVGALALLMPVGILSAKTHGLPPGRILMPLAFASILGGMTTLVGTPPNLLVAGFRLEATGESFGMFDFSPVGLPVALLGVAFIVIAGWRLVPARKGAATEPFETGAYLTEAFVADGSKAVGMTLLEAQGVLDELGSQVVGLIRRNVRIPASNITTKLLPSDILIVEADPQSLAPALSRLGLTLAEGGGERAEGTRRKPKAKTKDTEASERTEEGLVLIEVAVLPGSDLIGRSAADIRLQLRFGINLLALSRQGRRSIARLRTTPIRAGDVLLLQGPTDALGEFATYFGGVPLAERALHLPARGGAFKALMIMTVAVLAAVLGLVPAAVGFAAGVLLLLVFRVVPPGRIYGAVEWPVIVLLAALLPVADSLASTGVADLAAGFLVEVVARGHAAGALAVIMVLTMTFSDWMNNAATAAVMCPIAISTATGLEASADPFLMAVAVGASCAFLTPIGHQNNTLILGPGGFRFGDYWRLGLPLQALVLAVALPAILLVWPP